MQNQSTVPTELNLMTFPRGSPYITPKNAMPSSSCNDSMEDPNP